MGRTIVSIPAELCMAMEIFNRKTKFYFLSFIKHDFKASITVFFVALPLCLGISLASGVPVFSGLLAGIIGGLIVSILSGSQLSVSGPAAGLTAICAACILQFGNISFLFLATLVAGGLQVLLGLLKLGGFTRFIPSAVIKGMLAAIGIILMSKQIPILIGYDQANFWTKELFNIITLNHGIEHIENVFVHTSVGAIIITIFSFLVLIFWKKISGKKLSFIPTSFVIVFLASILAWVFYRFIPSLALSPTQYVHLPENLFSQIKLPNFNLLFQNFEIIKTGIIICFVATLETLLSIEAIDKLDPNHRSTPQNRELIAQGIGNMLGGLLGALPITAVIVRSSANKEAGAHTKLSSFFHGFWLLLVLLFLVIILSYVPFAVLDVILVQTGFNLAKPKMIFSVYKLGREQFIPFIVTVGAILLTDLLIGVCIGIAYAAYFILKNTYKAGFTLEKRMDGHNMHYYFRMAINVSFINKKKIKEELEKIPEYSIVEIDGSHSVYIDYDVLEILNEFKSKATQKHIELILKGIAEVELVSIH